MNYSDNTYFVDKKNIMCRLVTTDVLRLFNVTCRTSNVILRIRVDFIDVLENTLHTCLYKRALSR